MEQEYAQAKFELEIEKAVQQEKRKRQEIEGKLISELAEAKKQPSELKYSVESVSSSVNGSTDSIAQEYTNDSVDYSGDINFFIVTAVGSYVRPQVVN